MHTIRIFICVLLAMTAFSFVEAYVEGRNAGDKGKLGFRINVFGTCFAAYHFFLFYVMFPLLILILPFVVMGTWDWHMFGVLLSAYSTGVILEDFMWYVVNPAVKFKEWWTPFSDYYPWVRFGERKIIPWVYIQWGLTALLSWYFLWK